METPTKACSKCKQVKPLTAFAKHNRARDGLQGRCRDCNNAYAAENYQQKKAYYATKARARQFDIRLKIREAKTRPCMDCGNTFDPVCMDFDHRPDEEKTANVSALGRAGAAWEVIAAEIAKCDVICANCHRLRTRDRGYDL